MADVRGESTDLDALPGGIGWVVDGRYRIERLIGRGGVGAVYEATRLGTDERVAIKLVLGQYAKDDGVVSRFAREAKAASAIDDPHIVRVLDSGAHDGRPFLVIELLLGEDLGARLRRTKRLSEQETVHIVLQLLQGLVSAHAAGIVHRDLKPDNVLLVERAGERSFVKIVDFGTSKINPLLGRTAPLALTRRGVVVGTPLYMSPEQAEAQSDVDERSDLYSVGAIAFECLTGRPPHVGESDLLVLAAIRSSEAPSIRSLEPGLSEALGAFVDKALARDRTARFGSAGQMLEALRALAPADPALRLLAPSTPVVLAGAPSNPSLAFADTLPQSSGASRGTPPALIRAARIAPGGYPLAEKRSRTPRPRVAPKPRFFAWSWVAAFVAALGGVMTTAWVATSLSGRAPAGAQAPSSQADSVPLPRLAESSTRTAPPALDAGSSGVTGEPARGVKAGEDH